LRVPDELDAPANAARVTAPAIVITADADDAVMPKFQTLTFEALAGPKRRLNLRHKGHNDSIESPEEWREFRELTDWLVNLHP
jgi:pimeloyl-ACP methyl ester carboxylesterase